jgi:hypothetical protein
VLSAVAGVSRPGHIVYGPYWNLQPGVYDVDFSLRTPSNASATRQSRLATLDVYDGRSIVGAQDVTLQSMPPRNEWRRYRLTVEIQDPSNSTEFRVYWHGQFDLDVGPIRITKVDPAAKEIAPTVGRTRAGIIPSKIPIWIRRPAGVRE